jgi:hypothetical protein
VVRGGEEEEESCLLSSKTRKLVDESCATTIEEGDILFLETMMAAGSTKNTTRRRDNKEKRDDEDNIVIPPVSDCSKACVGGIGWGFTVCFVVVILFIMVLNVARVSSLVEPLDFPEVYLIRALYNWTATGVDQNPAALSAGCPQLGWESCGGEVGASRIQQI